MKVALSTIGKFHSFDLAREVHARNSLAAIYTGYPRFKLRSEGLPPELIRCFPYLHTPYMAVRQKLALPDWISRSWENLDAQLFGAHVARNLVDCDIYMGLSGSSLLAGRRAKAMGAKYICDRGSSHIRFQDRILHEENELWGIRRDVIVDPRVLAIEEAEYAEADRITVPSAFAYNSFVAEGVPPARLNRLAYGVNLSRFEPDGVPTEGEFNVLFVGAMSLRKGVQYLTQAFEFLEHPKKTLNLVGPVDKELIHLLSKRKSWPADVRVIGPVPQTDLKKIMSQSHVLVLPSIEEGLALVLSQAMACGCPVIATTNTGADDIVTNGEEGYVVPIRDVTALAQAMQRLADDRDLRSNMSVKALQRMAGRGGWTAYGEQAMRVFTELTA